MYRSRRFHWGIPYLLTDLKEEVFLNEPAICVGKKDSDMERPTLCAVCGKPLGATGYTSFFLMGPYGHGMDMMIGNGCLKDRIRERKVGDRDGSFRDVWNRTVAQFPHSGSWYGTFLHHSIAKPYVRDKGAADRWDESVLKLPGVRYIMGIIDSLRDSGWNLDAEMKLECGNIDLLATHPDIGTLVYDWKSDLCFDNHEQYIGQINRYMSELSGSGFRNISGYILWVRDERRERVPFRDVSDVMDVPIRNYVPTPHIRCSLKIDLNGGYGIEEKPITEYSHHRIYGDEVTFFIPPCDLWNRDGELWFLEASPYREGEKHQAFDRHDAKEGIHVSFICSKKRRKFELTATWKPKEKNRNSSISTVPKTLGVTDEPAFIEEYLPEPETYEDNNVPEPSHPLSEVSEKDIAELFFTPGRIYESGGKFYGIYKRLEPEKEHTAGKVDVAEVDCHGRKISDLEWRHIYMTQTGKEYIYGLSDRGWKIYTKNVLEDLAPEGMEVFGDRNAERDST